MELFESEIQFLSLDNFIDHKGRWTSPCCAVLYECHALYPQAWFEHSFTVILATSSRTEAPHLKFRHAGCRE